MNTIDAPYRLVAVEDLEAHALDLKQSKAKIAELASKIKELKAQAYHAEQALDFYATSKNYRPIGLIPKVAVTEDRGKRARKALGRIE